jgi:glyoxylase-like metal-dependent hydrolase (beta-lactamase superfamily II)
MKGWSLAWNTAAINFPTYKVIQVRRTGKGCLSYIVAGDRTAVVIDASLPVDVYKSVLAKEGLSLIAVLETHIHADHLSRSKQLANEFNVDLFLPIPNKVSFGFRALHHDQILSFEDLTFKVIATPGHTIESVTLLLNDNVLFTGDTLFANSVGRPDLKAQPEEVKPRAELLYNSLQMLIKMNESLIILPAHASEPIDFDHQPVMSNLKDVAQNKILRLTKEDFVDTVLHELPPTPPNYSSIIEKNLSGDQVSNIESMDLEAGANRCAISPVKSLG